MSQTDAPWLEQKRVVIIVNPGSHNTLKRKRRQQLDAWLRAEGWTVEWADTTAPGEATSIASRAATGGAPLVLVCGGDGTLNEAINGLAGSESAVGIIPAGTVNLWARELGIKRRKPLVALKQAITGERRRVDLGRAGQRYFLSMASYGIDAAVTAEVSHRLKGIVGAAAYAIASFREALRFRSNEFTLDMDGEQLQVRVLMVIASNTREYAGITQITPEAIVDDGLLDVRVFEGHGRVNIALHALRVLFRLHRRSKKVHFRRVRRLAMRGETAMPLQVDGDFRPESAAEVVCVPRALWVVVPRGFTSPMFSPPQDH